MSGASGLLYDRCCVEGCIKGAVWNHRGKYPPLYCWDHKTDEMIRPNPICYEEKERPREVIDIAYLYPHHIHYPPVPDNSEDELTDIDSESEGTSDVEPGGAPAAKKRRLN